MTKLIPASKLDALPLYYDRQYIKYDDLRALIDAEPDSNLIAEKQSTIDRLTEQQDMLIDALKDLEAATRHFHPCQATMEKCTALIAEIEGHSKYARDE